MIPVKAWIILSINSRLDLTSLACQSLSLTKKDSPVNHWETAWTSQTAVPVNHEGDSPGVSSDDEWLIDVSSSGAFDCENTMLRDPSLSERMQISIQTRSVWILSCSLGEGKDISQQSMPTFHNVDPVWICDRSNWIEGHSRIAPDLLEFWSHLWQTRTWNS